MHGTEARFTVGPLGVLGSLTPLGKAEKNGHEAVVQALFEVGASLEVEITKEL